MGVILALAGLMGAVAIGLATWVGHSVAYEVDPAHAERLTTAVRYLQIHAAVAAAAALAGPDARMARLAGWGFLLGAGSFSAGLFASVLAPGPLGMLSPIGGLILIAAWLALAAEGVRRAMRQD